MLTCRDTSRLVSDAMERELGLTTRVGLRMHLLLCPPCKHYERQIHLLRKAARAVCQEVTEADLGGAGLSDEARERIAKALQDARS